MDFSRAALIVRVATQGRQDYRQWVTQYYLRYSLDGIHFVDYKQRHTRKVDIYNQRSSNFQLIVESNPQLLWFCLNLFCGWSESYCTGKFKGRLEGFKSTIHSV